MIAECRTLGGCPTGAARATGAYDLPARIVIHTVGPIWKGGEVGEADLLAACYRSSLALARRHECPSIAFPAISCGVYGYPLQEAARVSLATVREELDRHSGVDFVRWVMFDPAAYEAWLDTFGV